MDRNSGTTTLTGDILGSGELTLDGPGDWILAGTGVTYTNTLIIINCTVQVTGDFPDLINILVDSGGVLEALQSQFPSGTIETQNGGVWNFPDSATWTGNGDGTHWTNAANWAPNVVPTNKATIPSGVSPVNITVDTPTYLDTLFMNDNAGNNIDVDANMCIRFVEGDPAGNTPFLTINAATLTVYKADSAYMYKLKGDGEFVKEGDTTVVITSSDNDFTGRMTVNDGLLRFRSVGYQNATNVTVNDGGTVQLEGVGTPPYEFILNGNGHNDTGALRAQQVDHDLERVTAASDTRIVSVGSVTTELTDDIDGTGVLTLDGPGDWEISGTGIAYTNKIIVTNTTTTLFGDFPDLINILVDQGGVLEAAQSQFPSASVVTQNGGIWNQPTSAQWTGNGDGSNWTDTANWAPNIVPTNTATIPVQASALTILVDAPTYVETLVIFDDPLVDLRIDQDMEIAFLDDANNQPGITLNGATLTLHRADSAYMGKLGGAGTLAKVSDNQVTLNSTAGYTGEIHVIDGLFFVRGGGGLADWGTVSVESGATLQVDNPTPSEGPWNLFISGTGHGANGSLHNNIDSKIYSNLTIVADATVKTDAEIVLKGTLAGPGDMTKIGNDALDLDGIYNCVLNGTDANSVIADSGTFDISDATLSVSGEENIGPFIKEFIIIDYSGGATVISPFAATNDLKVNWGIDYDGTEDNPDAVVLVQLPTSGSVLEFE